jgi:hypothetical protein
VAKVLEKSSSQAIQCLKGICEPTGHRRLPFDHKVPPQHRLGIWRDHRQDIV